MVSAEQVIVVAIDFSDPARFALEKAIELTRRSEAELHVVHVCDYPAPEYSSTLSSVREDVTRKTRAEASRRLLVALEQIEGEGLSATPHLVDGRAAPGIEKVVEQVGADLLVIGTHGHTGFTHLALGSVAERAARHVPCSVLIVKAPRPA